MAIAGKRFNWYCSDHEPDIACGRRALPAARAQRNKEHEFLMRLGGEYGFALKSGSEIARAAYFDITSEDVAMVIGASAALRF